MQFIAEPYKLLLAWTVAFSILEPVVAWMNHSLSQAYGIKTMFQMYPKTSPFVIVMSEYIYFTIIFVKSMYIYKHVLGKPTYYPRQGHWKDYQDFLLCYIVVQLIIDVGWSVFISNVTSHVPVLEFVKNYSRELGFYALMRPLVYGLVLLAVTEGVFRHLGDLEAIGALLFGLFIVTIASF